MSAARLILVVFRCATVRNAFLLCLPLGTSELHNFYDLLSGVPVLNIRVIPHNWPLQLRERCVAAHVHVEGAEGGGQEAQPGGPEGEADHVCRSDARARSQVGGSRKTHSERKYPHVLK